MIYPVTSMPSPPSAHPLPPATLAGSPFLKPISNLRAFALAVPSAWNTLQIPPIAYSLVSLPPWLKCRLIDEAFPDRPNENQDLPLLVSCFIFLLSTCHLLTHIQQQLFMFWALSFSKSAGSTEMGMGLFTVSHTLTQSRCSENAY